MPAHRPLTILGYTLFVVLLVALAAPVSHASPPFYTETIEGGGTIGDYIRLAVDTDGIPHVVYWDYSNQFLWYAKRVDGAWTWEIVEATAYVGTDADIAVDAQGVPHVCFHNYTAANIEELRYAVRTGGIWTVEDVDPFNNDVGTYCSIAIDSQGNPHVMYYNGTLGNLKYAVRTGGWSVETADGGVGTGRFGDLALDSSDRPHIVYYVDGLGVARYSTKISSSWISENIGPQTADYMGIALDPAGNPVITSNSGGYLNLYVRQGGMFQNVGGWYPFNGDGAIAIDNTGTVHLLCQSVDGGANDLWHVEYRDSMGTTSPAALGGVNVNLGSKCDVALDPYGNPVGVYFDATNFDAIFIDSGVRLSSALAGATWPVGSERSVSWKGAGSVNVYLSSDGGATYDELALGLASGGGGGSYNFTVPHQPSRFCKVKLVRTSPYSASFSDSLFTIEASVALLNFTVSIPDGGGTSLTWSTNPGPDDLAGYRVDRRRDAESWSTLTALTNKTAYHDGEGRSGDEYRLFAVNGLGEELLLGTGSPDRAPAATVLDVFPNPFSTGNLTVDFATAGGLGGGAGHATVAIYDVAGRLVRTLTDRAYPAGMQRVTWDGRNAQGVLASSGVYFVRSVAGAQSHTKKVLVVR